MKIQRSSTESLRAHHERSEREAFERYASALRAWERVRDCADDLGHELASAEAQWQAKTIAGCPARELDNLRKLCRDLQERERDYRRQAVRARSEASRCFTALIAARNARAEFDRCAQQDEANVLSLSNIEGLESLPTLRLGMLHWN